jgi:hypothetical protein
MLDKIKKPHARRHSSPPDSADAFLPDVSRTHEHLARRVTDDGVEGDAETFLAAATSGEYSAGDAQDEVSDAELGGPFLEVEVEPRRERRGRRR